MRLALQCCCMGLFCHAAACFIWKACWFDSYCKHPTVTAKPSHFQLCRETVCIMVATLPRVKVKLLTPNGLIHCEICALHLKPATLFRLEFSKYSFDNPVPRAQGKTHDYFANWCWYTWDTQHCLQQSFPLKWTRSVGWQLYHVKQ